MDKDFLFGELVMPKTCQYMIAVLFSSAVFFLLPNISNAQEVPDYLFLEVMDSKGAPVPSAEVQTVKSDFNRTGSKQFTDEKGAFRFYLPWSSHYENLDSYFTVIKDGFFTYHDFGGSGRWTSSNARIELLKIPQNNAEKLSLGNEQLRREFMWAVKTGDAETVKKLLKKGISPNLTTTDLRGVSGRKDVPAILFAALSADSETVETLIKAGVRIEGKEEPIRSILSKYLRSDPFFWKKPKDENERKSILKKYENGVDILLKSGADYTFAAENDLKSPISIAAEKGYIQAVKLLLDKGVSINNKDSNGKSLLSYAADGDWEGKESKLEIIEFLLARGIDPQNECSPALFTASARGDLPVIQILLKKGAKINPKCGSPLFDAVERQRLDAAKFLIDSGADINYRGNYGENLLMIAAKYNNAEMVKLLLDRGFPVNMKSANGATALWISTDYSSFSESNIIELLLKAGANPDAALNYDNSVCSTPLIRSVERDNPMFIKLLIEYKANINLACPNGDTPLIYAIRRYKPETVKQLIELGAEVSGENIDKMMNLIKTFYKEDDYYRKYIDETIKLVEEARAKRKVSNN
jgi:ankyrin repeat protein